MTIAGRVALIAGASGAIGHALSLEFARQGAIVALGSRSPVDPDLLLEVVAINPSCREFRLDVTDPLSIEAAIDQVERQLGSVAFLLNATGAYGPIGPVAESDSTHWASAVQTNIVGAFNLVHAVAPRMDRNGGGRIVHFSGGGGTYGRPNFSCYSACKAALLRFTESAGEELAAKNIFMNAIAPGPVKSPMWEDLRAAGAAAGDAALRELQSMDEKGGVPAEHAAKLAVLLASTAVPIAGRVISAVWDDWEHLELHAGKILNSDAWTLRRVPLDGQP
jgi:3-oxoacyl-[acyl-carrier protein] reductase